MRYIETLHEGVACNDDMALGASKALHQAGLKIPQDISLFGFDDAPSAKWLEPALSSVYLPIDNMIVTAIDQAIRLARNQPVDAIPPFTGTLVLRDSVTTGLSVKCRLNTAVNAARTNVSASPPCWQNTMLISSP